MVGGSRAGVAGVGVAQVDLTALAHNLARVRRLAPGQQVIAVVKADAYGLGAVAAARRLAADGVEGLAVVTLDEAAELRDGGIQTQLLLLGGLHEPADADRAVALGVQPVLHGPAPIEWLERAAAATGGPVPVQVEVDTGMRRMGCPVESGVSLLCDIASSRGLFLAGVFTHLACADDPDPQVSREQLARFGAVLEQAAARGVRPPSVHVANSAGVLQGPELAGHVPAAVNGVRPGLMLYGAVPAPHQRERAGLRPVLSIRSRVVAVRPVESGDPVGYGGSFRARAAGRLATVPLGYADGIPWSLGNRGVALVGGVRMPYAGRVSMDYVTLFVGDAEVSPGDEVVIFGRSSDGRFELPVEELASAAGTLCYELLVRVGRRLPREVIG